jgi:glycosyltransferase involved in cell wall biosynthesis
MEWIIIDDGTDKIEDMVTDISNVRYYKYDEKMPLGKKRNIMHKKSKGDILVYMDDDDYYPPCRVSHAVNMLLTHPKALCAGSSEIYIYFKHIDKMIQFGPYGPNHATAGTFAFKRELLKDHMYEDTAALAEEKAFLKNYSVPFVQLEPKKTILVFSHIHNTFDKKTLLDNPHPKFVKETDKTVDDFVKENDLKDFYMNQIDSLLQKYEPGDPSMKPDVLKQIKELKAQRAEMEEERKKEYMNKNGMEHKPFRMSINGEMKDISIPEAANILEQQHHMLVEKNSLLSNMHNKLTEAQQLITHQAQKIIKLEEDLNNK